MRGGYRNISTFRGQLDDGPGDGAFVGTTSPGDGPAARNRVSLITTTGGIGAETSVVVPEHSVTVGSGRSGNPAGSATFAAIRHPQAGNKIISSASDGSCRPEPGGILPGWASLHGGPDRIFTLMVRDFTERRWLAGCCRPDDPHQEASLHPPSRDTVPPGINLWNLPPHGRRPDPSLAGTAFGNRE